MTLKMKLDIKSQIDNVILPESFICVHGISKAEIVMERIKSIFDNGLYMKYDGGINSNCIAFGEYNCFDFEKILNYSYFKDRNGISANIIIAIPKIISDYEGKEYYIGPFEDLYVGGDVNRIKRVCSHPFNAFINKNKHLMSEFILGAYVKDNSGNYLDFIINNNYIGLKTSEDKIRFYTSLKKEIFLKCLSDSISSISYDASYYYQNFKQYKLIHGYKKYLLLFSNILIYIFYIMDFKINKIF